MKTLFKIAAGVAIINVLAAAGLLGWLIGTHRMNRARVDKVAAIFSPTLEQEKAREEEETKKAEELKTQAQTQARLSGLDGSGSAAERLVEEQQRNELLLRQLERTRQDIKSLSDNLMLTRTRMEREKSELLTARTELTVRLDEMEKRLNDAGFKKAVALYESLPAKQVRAMFDDLMTRGKTEEVVAYLEAMQPRKAAGVLKEFGADAGTVARAVELTERLRARGSELVKQVEHAG
ncbi:MAG: hypothetical protein WC058_11430 [Phycisphaeraceae bacterium]